MCQGNRIRHVLLGLIGCETEHHTLVTCTDGIQCVIVHGVLFFLQCGIHTQCNILGLLIQRYDHAAGIAVKSIFRAVITNFTYGLAHDLLNVNIRVGGNLTHDHNQAGGGAGLTCNTAHRVFFHQRIQNCIRNCIAHFIRMSLGNRLGSKQ